ncbi:hypothetical protein SAMN05444008_12060 [Cnuella takakiae]|uniref:Uncharacterized protein n=1 Tax=Cnuella takakiae TaxID=1302690 RepID=A0A1M5HU71_9BACT|nr:hypothetical protein SAMN05444008_12060 [Cnuella takakiae]
MEMQPRIKSNILGKTIVKLALLFLDATYKRFLPLE